MTSSLRNSLHRRNHKERGQLAHRSRLGLLEKHSDYVKRARDYHAKQDRINRLRQKAAERNKDEFYFAMNNEKTKKGVHIKDRGNAALPTDIVKVLKTQDENYVRTVRTSNLKKIDQIKQKLMSMSNLLRDLASLKKSEEITKDDLQDLKAAGILSKAKVPKTKAKHIRFDEDKSIAEESLSLELGQDETRLEDLGWKSTSSSHRIPSQEEPVHSETDTEDRSSQITLLVKELSARLFRDKQLRYSLREFELQRSMMGKGARNKILAAETEGNSESDDDEDALDARGGRRNKDLPREVDEKLYKPRVYKWKLQRK